MASATSYKAIDPIVFSVTGAYRFSRRYGHAGDTRRNGNLLMLAPSVGFAVDKQAHAGEAAVRTTPAPQPMAAFSQQDINGLFDQADKPMQLAALSRQEMKETEGAWVQWAGMAALGGVMNTATYIGSNSNWTYRGAAWAALSGASGALIGGLPIGGAAARAGLAAVGAYTAGQPWGGYSWARW